MAETSTGTQAVDRAAQLVSTVVHASEPLTFADLQEASGLAKSTTSLNEPPDANWALLAAISG